MKAIVLYISLFFVCFGFAASSDAYGQVGLPYLTHYKVPVQLGSQMWGIVQGENQEMFFLNRKGVFAFDGYGWEVLPLKDRPFAMCSNGKLYVSTEKGIYSFVRAAKGQFVSHPVAGNGGDFYHKFIKVGDKLYAVGMQHFAQVVAGESDALNTVFTEKDSSHFLTEAFAFRDEIFVVKDKSHIFKLKGAAAVPLNVGLPYLVDINFTFGDGKSVFVGLSNNKLFRFDGKSATQVVLKDQSYLDASYLSGGIMVDETHIALSTMLGGSVVVDVRNGETVAMINYNAGLPDDEISALGIDGQKGLWLAHGMGISRVDFQMPLSTFNHFPGLSGNLLSIAEFNGKSYVGTSEGVFVLDAQKDYKETVISVKERVTVPRAAPASVAPAAVAPLDGGFSADKKKKGFFSRMFGGGGNKAVAEKVEVAKVEDVLPTTIVKTSKKKLLTLQSINYYYRKIAGVEGKCQQLIVLSGKLLAITSRGVFEIGDGGSMPIVVGKNVRVATPSGSNKSLIWLGGDDGISSLVRSGSEWKYNPAISLGNNEPTSIVELNINELLVSTESKVLRVLVGGKGAPMNLPVNGMRFDSPLVRQIAGKVRIISANKVFTYDVAKNGVVRDSLEFPSAVSRMIMSQEQFTWICFDRTWKCYSDKGLVGNANAQFIALFDKVNSIFVTSANDLLVVDGFKEVVRIAVPKGFENVANVPIVVKRVEDRDGLLLDINEIVLTYANNSLNISLASPSYIKEQSTEYQYIIEGMMGKWTEWSSNPELHFPFFPSGSYTLKIRARDLLGRQSEIYSLDFRIKPPFWKSFWFIAICAVAFLALVLFIIRVREQRLVRDKIMLEQKVRMRTQTIEEQKQELEVQRDALAIKNGEIMQQKEEIETQRDEIEAQRDHIAMQSDNITKSIEYAKRIQTAAMPSHSAIKAILPEHFIMFKPRDIVSGDFFWATSYHGKVIVAAADCTGHGVPGAFMSMLGLSFLNEVVMKVDDLHPNIILNQLRAFIKNTLSQNEEESGSKDGMDIAICIIDYENRQLEFAGAYNPLYYVKDGELLEVKGDKMPVGIHLAEKDSFTNHVMPLDGITAFYLFSDGFLDQFGGENNTKFKAKNFKELLFNIQSKPMAEQNAILEEVFEGWKGDCEQVDDVLVLGVKVG